MVVNPYVEPTVLESLSTLLERTKANNGYLDEEFVDIEGTIAQTLPFNRLPQCNATLKALMTLRTTLRSYADGLDTIASFLTSLTASVKRRSVPLAFHVGIQSLPHEILSRIFEEAYDESNGDYTIPLNISWVCRHFRAVAVRTARLWCKVSNSLPIGLVRLFLERSKLHQIHVIISDDGDLADMKDFAEFLQLVAEEEDRWHCLNYWPIYHDRREDIPAFQTTSNLFLPQLDTLELDSRMDSDIMRSFDFISHWSMPTLSTVTSTNLMPHIAWSSALTTWRYTITSYDDIGWNDLLSLDLSPLYEALQSMPLLRSFHLSVDQMFICDDDTENKELYLPNLQDTRIQMELMSHPRWVLGFLSQVQAPNLKDLRIVYTYQEYRTIGSDGWNAWETLLRTNIVSFPALEELSISLSEVPLHFSCDSVLRFLLRLLSTQSLKALVCTGPSVLLTSSLREVIPSTLSTLMFQDCDRLCLSNLRPLVETLLANSRSRETLQQVILERCSNVISTGIDDTLEDLRCILGDRLIVI